MSIIKKDGTELTGYELYLVYAKNNGGFVAVMDYLESVLPQREGVSVEEIRKYLSNLGWLSLTVSDELAKHIQPLTVQQGFVPDWSKAPMKNGDLPDKVVVFWWWDHGGMADYPAIHHWHRPKVKRMRTRGEKIAALESIGVVTEFSILMFRNAVADSTIDNLCDVANIPLEVEE